MNICVVLIVLFWSQVEKILDSKKIKGKTHFLIRWKGYQSESDTWEPENTVACPELITKFKQQVFILINLYTVDCLFWTNRVPVPNKSSLRLALHL